MRRHFSGAGCGARACASQAQVREAPGHRPPPLRGAARKGWTRAGRTEAKVSRIKGENALSVPGSAVPEFKIAAMERRKASVPIARDATPQGVD